MRLNRGTKGLSALQPLPRYGTLRHTSAICKLPSARDTSSAPCAALLPHRFALSHPTHSSACWQDPKKYARAKELLIMDEEIKKAKQLVDDVGPTAN